MPPARLHGSCDLMHSLRVISGKARGMRLRTVPGDTTRPITDKVKEALFNILAPEIPGASFLDLFAGTGAVGIEALSQGAAFVRFLDLAQPAIRTIHQNLETTRLSTLAQVIRTESLGYLKTLPDRTFDIIYIAPPQYKGLWLQTLQILDANPGWLSPSGQIITQIHPIEYQEIAITNFSLFDQRRYGSTMLLFYERRTAE